VAVDTVMAPRGIASLVSCVEAAGGVVTSLDGMREGIIHWGYLLTSRDERPHREVLDLSRPDRGDGADHHQVD
jgi:hypothetical protein